MTENQWLMSEDPRAMLLHLGEYSYEEPVYGGITTQSRQRRLASDRQLRLFACAATRQVLRLLTDESGRLAVEAAERYADGLAAPEELRAACARVDRVTDNDRWTADDLAANAADLENIAPHLARYVPSICDWAERYGPAPLLSGAAQAALLRDIVGNPFRPVTLPYAGARGTVNYSPGMPIRLDDDASCPWLTPQVLTLARVAYEERPRRKCEHCGGLGEFEADEFQPGGCCPMCRGAGRIDDGSLDPLALLALADALEEAGAGERCKECHGSGTYTVQATNPGLSAANGYGAATTYSEWRGCRHCGGDYNRKGTGSLPHPLLAHLRSPGPHVRGCHAVDLILGKE
jgi:hypothetical protein